MKFFTWSWRGFNFQFSVLLWWSLRLVCTWSIHTWSVPVLWWFAPQYCEDRAYWGHYQLHPAHSQFQEPKILIFCSGNLHFLFLGYLQEVGLNPTDQGYLADLVMKKLQENFFKQFPTRGLNTTRSIPLRPKSEIFAGIPFTCREISCGLFLPFLRLLHLELDDQVAGKDNVHVHDHLLPADVLVVHLDSRDPRRNLSKSNQCLGLEDV